jgi:hypothetical protein
LNRGSGNPQKSSVPAQDWNDNFCSFTENIYLSVQSSIIGIREKSRTGIFFLPFTLLYVDYYELKAERKLCNLYLNFAFCVLRFTFFCDWRFDNDRQKDTAGTNNQPKFT